MLKCPKCGSEKISQYRTPFGHIWCDDCGFRAKRKEKDNPFVAKGKGKENERKLRSY